MTARHPHTEPRPPRRGFGVHGADLPIPFTPLVEPGTRVVIVRTALPPRICQPGDRGTVLRASEDAIEVSVDRTRRRALLVPGADDGWSRIGEVSDP